MASDADTAAGCTASVGAASGVAVALRRLRLVGCASGSGTGASEAASVGKAPDGTGV